MNGGTVPENKQLYNLEIHEVISTLKTTHEGLSDAEAAKRLDDYGPNVLSTAKTSLWRRIIEPFASYFVIIIVFAALISLVEQKWFEAGVISLIIVVNAVIYYVQQFSVNKAINSLMAQDKQIVRAVRDGKTVEVSADMLVPGDVIHVEEGMKVPADGRLIDTNHVQSDESMLTGESLPIRKHAGAITGNKEVYDQDNMLFRGTYVKSGTGLLVITTTGNSTQMGAISTLAAGADNGKTPIERKIDRLTRNLLIAVGTGAVLVFGLAIARGIHVDEALQFVLSLTVSAVPEGLPVAMTLVLILSARKMTNRNALVKKISAMETMGAITFIATDKTGTLTQNKLSVADTYVADGDEPMFRQSVKASLNGDQDYSVDPLDELLHASVADASLPQGAERIAEFPFDQELRLSATVWKVGKSYALYVKGAPEQVLHHCGKTNTATKTALDGFTNKGYRAIGFATKTFAAKPKELNHRTLANLTLSGFVALSDQLRPNVSKAIAEARAAGISVVMLTGDHVKTAAHIAQEVGITDGDGQVADSTVLASGSPTEIRAALKTTRVFGRVLPEHKYALLKALDRYEITAMTGDGVNDIPALVQADAGLAMGSGTDAAKDASDVVLVDDNFETIVGAVRTGRTVLANIRKMVVYLLSTSAGEVMTMLIALGAGIPLPVTAVMLLWVNMVTDGFTVIPLGLSPSEKHHMLQPPRNPKAPLLDKVLLSRTIVLAFTTALIMLGLFDYLLPKGETYAQTAAFLALIVLQWANALNMNFEYRSWIYNFLTPNYKLLLAITGSIALNAAVFMTGAREWFGLEQLAVADALLAIILPIGIIFTVCDAHKLLTNRYAQRLHSHAHHHPAKH
jgi:Ca2+-transporting ATPase